MDPLTLFAISISLTLLIAFVIIVFINKQTNTIKESLKNDNNQDVLTEWLKNMQGTMDSRLKTVAEELNKSSDNLSQRVDKTSNSLNERLDKAAKVIGDVQKELGSMSEIGRSMRDLQSFLKSPKLRGNIGEQILKELLQEMLPNSNYSLQHTFKNGQIVDALIKVDEGYISVDSKFPMENFNLMIKHEDSLGREEAKKAFNKDVRKHITDISKKYILPEEGTVDFALMYIPSEAIYYEVVVNNEELGKFAWSQRVLPVSPNVFYSYLKAILIGLEGKKIESRAKEILSAIRGIKQESTNFSDSLRVLTKHINNAKNMADDATKGFEKLDNRINSLDNISRIEGETVEDAKQLELQ